VRTPALVQGLVLVPRPSRCTWPPSRRRNRSFTGSS